MDHRKVKLGIKAVKHDSRTLKLSKYIGSLPPALHSCVWAHGIKNWGMMLNDELGDCTIAAIGHAIQVWSYNATGQEITVPDSQILRLYESWAGYDPKHPATDQGAIELDILKQWKKGSFDGYELTAFASINPLDLNELRQAIDLFGGVYVGMALPLSCQDQKIWYPVQGPNGLAGSWGGHAVFVPNYGPSGFTFVTWGELQSMTNDFWLSYGMEAYALLSPVFINNGNAPSGFDLAALEADLALIH